MAGEPSFFLNMCDVNKIEMKRTFLSQHLRKTAEYLLWSTIQGPNESFTAFVENPYAGCEGQNVPGFIRNAPKLLKFCFSRLSTLNVLSMTEPVAINDFPVSPHSKRPASTSTQASQTFIPSSVTLSGSSSGIYFLPHVALFIFRLR